MKNFYKNLKTLALLALVLSFQAVVAQTAVKGTVKDAAGNPVIGASIIVKGTTNGTTTDLNGNYSIQAKKGDVLCFDYIGFTSQEVEVGAQSTIDFSVTENVQAINDVVVVGYGTLKKTQLVGAVENISGEEISDRQNANVTRSLQGMVPGLNIIQTDGKPTHEGQIFIRGNATTYSTRTSATSATGKTLSIGQGGSALVLIDGIEGDLTSLNPDDIETISVLKDAASSAVYGARGAYGVILVTTKNAKKDKLTVNYNGTFSLSSRVIKYEDELVTDGLTWLDNFAEFFQSDSRTPTSAGKAASNINNRANTYSNAYHEEMRRRYTDPTYENYRNPYGVDEKGNYQYYASTNWYDLFYRDVTTATTHNLSISGASDRASYVISGRYQYNNGIFKVGDEAFNKYNFRAKGDIKLTDWLKIANNTHYNRSSYHQPRTVGDTSYTIARQIEHRCQPVYTPYNEDGTVTYWGACSSYDLFRKGLAYQQEDRDVLSTTTSLIFEPVKDVLRVVGDFTFKNTQRQVVAVSPISKGILTPAGGSDVYNATSFKQDSRYKTDYLAANVVATWTPKLGDNHNLNVVAGWNIEKTKYRYLTVNRQGLLYDTMPSFELMDSDQYTLTDSGFDKKMVGVFARLNYTLFNRYIFEFAGRYDGSSLFPKKQQWGFFPSASIGWRLSDEPFMDWSDSWLDNFKIRANVGSLGNAQINPYSFLELMSVNKSSIVVDKGFINYVNPAEMIPAGLTWETVTTYDIGVDIDVLRNRLSASFDYYWRFTNDLLVTGPDYPQILGNDSPKGNYGSLKTRGWEATLAWKDSFKLGGKDFKYNIKASVWDSRTWVRDFYNESGDIYNYYAGKELGEIWGFRTDGYFLTQKEASEWVDDTFHKNGSNFHAYAGDLKFLDLNGNEKIDYGKATITDHGDLARIGNNTPRFQYGINLGASWNGIGFSMFIQGVGKRDWYFSDDAGMFWGMYNRPYGNLPKMHLSDGVIMDYSSENWTVTNPGAYWTRKVAYVANRNVGPLAYENDYYLQDASYWRIKNITFEYTFPQALTRKIKIERLRVYISGENVFTRSPLFKHTKLIDPEGLGYGDSDFATSKTGLSSGNNEGAAYPMLKTWTIGLNITF